ncbi:MAG: ABC transporter ATP-binding protein [Armatimonadota bacterium]
MSEPLLDVRGLRKVYASQAGRGHLVTAADDVSFHVLPGETFGLVGESGCGKSTVARCIMRLIEPTGGEVWFEGEELVRLNPNRLRPLRRRMQMVFQDPYSSLDPRMTIRASLLEPLEIHRVGSRAEREARVRELIGMVGLPESALAKYPHEFSGGQRQRVGIARALALSPRLVIADEPVSALDLSIRAQVINLMADLQRQLGLAYLFIAHDLTLVRHVCHRVAVMSRGRIVEIADTEALFRSPTHPYTRRLLASIPIPDPHQRDHPRPEPEAEEQETGAALPLVEIAPGHLARV